MGSEFAFGSLLKTEKLTGSVYQSALLSVSPSVIDLLFVSVSYSPCQTQTAMESQSACVTESV